MTSQTTTVPGAERVRWPVASVPVYAATIGLAAALVFLVQPMAAKMLLPSFGGSPAVWAVSLVFFQAVLLAGYSWAHLSLRLLPLRAQALVQVGLLLLPLALLPVAMPSDAAPASGESPALRLLATLLVAVGAPFFAVTTASPVLQRWFSAGGHGASRDPYFLYAASNAGSLLGLLAYPFLIEPRLTLAQQSRLWLAGYAAFLALAAVAALRLVAAGPRARVRAAVALAPPLGWRLRLRWVALAAVPSSLILGTTSHLSTSIAAVPLLWVLPLAAYLLSFVVAFARRASLGLRGMSIGVVVSSLLVVASLLHVVRLPIAALVAIHVGNLFLVALLVHRRLADERPPVERLTEFYLLLSLGGVAGGAANALLAPVVFDAIVEYPLALALALLALPGQRSLRRDVLVPALFLALLVLGIAGAAALGTVALRAVLGVAVVALALLARRPLRLALATGALLLLATLAQPALHAERTFFGVLRVVEGEHGERLLAHGTTLHGSQVRTPGRRDDPLTYYTRQGPLGRVFAARRGELRDVAVVGLGAGSIAAYGRPGERYDFYEIDPAVARIASDERWFTYLAESRADTRIVIGDGRLRLRAAPVGRYDLIVLDAFSSDAVPVHLLTREAVALYLTKLSGRGLLAFHVTNNHLDLEPVVAGVARSLGLAGVARLDDVSAERRRAGALRSHWVVLGREPADLARLRADPRWRPLSEERGQPVWTDGFSNVLSVVDWSR